MDYINLIKAFIPLNSQFLTINTPYRRPAIIFTDLNGDGLDEIVAAYKHNEENYIIIIKNNFGRWVPLYNIKGKGYDINYLDAYPITSNKFNNLIVGWQIGTIWSELNILQLTHEGFRNIVPEGTAYSKIEIEAMPEKNWSYTGYEIALWTHDTGEAYYVEVYRWRAGRLIPALGVYLYYFKKVVKYYEKKVLENPDSGFYWYHLAIAQLKAGMKTRAFVSVNKALSLASSYPGYSGKLLKLKEEIEARLKMRSVELYPGVLRTVNGNIWGFINNKGEFVIKPQYDYAMDFQNNGLAVIGKNDLQGIIDNNGRYVVEPKYQSVSQFSQGLANIVDNEGTKVINERGDIITTKAYGYIGVFKESRAIFAGNTTSGKYLYGYLDMLGKEIIPQKYQSANDFNNGKALVQIGENEFALIDNVGKTLNSYKYSFVGYPGGGLLAFRESSQGKYGYINEDGKVVLPPRYTYAFPFIDGKAVVNIGEGISNKYGLIDMHGEFIIAPKYNDIIVLGENRLGVGRAIDESRPYIGSKYSIADTDGNFLTDFVYNTVSEYKAGVASVNDNINTFFIDKRGKTAENLPVVKGAGTLTLVGDLIKALVDFRLSYFNREGRVVFNENKIIILNDIYSVLEEKFKPNKDYIVYYPKVQGMTDEVAQSSVNERLKVLSQVKRVSANTQLDYSYYGDFSVEYFNKNLLVLKLEGYNFPFGAAHGMPTKIFANINLITGHFYELKDFFKPGSNYVKELSTIIGNQIKNNPEYSYVFPDSYKGIKSDQPFYIKDDTLYIYFNPYEIAPYVAGFPTFRIPGTVNYS